MARKLVIGRCVHNYKPVACYGECGTHCPIWSNFTDPDPVAIWTPNPKECAGEADAIEELDGWGAWGWQYRNGQYFDYAPAQSRLADRIKEIEMGKTRRVTIDLRITIGELIHIADCILPQEILCPITRNGTAGELLEAVENWLNDPQKPERRQEPTECAPTHFASIAPRFASDNAKRAPIDQDLLVCRIEREGVAWSTTMKFLGGAWRFSDRVSVITYCPHCDGLLPTHDKHEGSTGARKPTHFGGDYLRFTKEQIEDSVVKGGLEIGPEELASKWNFTQEIWDRLRDDAKRKISPMSNDATYSLAFDEPHAAIALGKQDATAKRKREDAEIKSAWQEALEYDDCLERVLGFLKSNQARCVEVFTAHDNLGHHLVFEQCSHPRDVEGCYLGRHSDAPKFRHSRAGAELLSLLFPAPIMGSKEAPSAWVAVEDGLPKDSETVLVKLEKDDEPDEPTLGYYHNFPRIGIVWTYQKLGGEVKLDRHEGAAVNKATHWQRIE